MLEVRADGVHLRPAPDGYGAEIYASLDEVDMLEIYRELRCPLLLVNAVPADPASMPGPPWLGELMAAFRKGQTRDLEALAAKRPNVKLVTVTGSHGLLFEQPETIAEVTLHFLDGTIRPLTTQ
jgi:pimeloyl-ACP methyl ester carboxylesterase